MPIQQRKGDNCYNADGPFEIARYAIPGTEYILSMIVATVISGHSLASQTLNQLPP